MIKFQKRCLIETLENNGTNPGHKHTAHFYSSCFQEHLYDESALPRFEVLTALLHKCNEHRPYYATQYQDNFFQYNKRFNFITGKASAEFKDAHVTVFEGSPPIPPYTKAKIRNGYAIPQESPVYCKSEKYEPFKKQNWFGDVHPNLQTDAKLDYMVRRVLLEMDHTSLSNYKNFVILTAMSNRLPFSY